MGYQRKVYRRENPFAKSNFGEQIAILSEMTGTRPCELLGIDAKKVVSFELKCDVNTMPTLMIKQYVDENRLDENGELKKIIMEYELVPIENK